MSEELTPHLNSSNPTELLCGYPAASRVVSTHCSSSRVKRFDSAVAELLEGGGCSEPGQEPESVGAERGSFSCIVAEIFSWKRNSFARGKTFLKTI
jgi:hypothetical protein